MMIMIIGIMEIVDILLMTFAIGFIFSDVFARFMHHESAYPVYRRGFDWKAIKFGAIVAAPAVVLHEVGHKVVGMIFGLTPVIHASYFGLGLGVLLKLVQFPFIFFIPGYASLCEGQDYLQCSAFLDANPLINAAIAFGGPLMNLLMWIFATLAVKNKWFDRKYFIPLVVVKQMNMFLFFMNMIPLWFFDGATVFGGIIQYISSLF